MPEKKPAIPPRAGQVENLDCLSNDFTLQADWLRIPFGDHPHSQAVQRLTRQTADSMAAGFKSVAGRLGRLFGGVPIYIGHPDDPRLANDYPDRKAYGWIMDMEARADGLYVKPKWSPAGEELLANAHYKWFSPYWGCKDIGREKGKRVVEPVRLYSLGLTNSPNIQGILPLANEEENYQPSDHQTPQKGMPKPMKQKLIALLGLANDGAGAEPADEAILAAVTGLKSQAAAAETALSNEKGVRVSAEKLANDAHVALVNEQTERKAKEAELQTAFSNERKARIEAVLDQAIAAGKITAAQRPQWASDLVANFEGKLVELANVKPALNTTARTKGLGARNSTLAAGGDASIRRDKVLALVNERMNKTGEDYEPAFAAIRKENQALFDEMAQPGQK